MNEFKGYVYNVYESSVYLKMKTTLWERLSIDGIRTLKKESSKKGLSIHNKPTSEGAPQKIICIIDTLKIALIVLFECFMALVAMK